LEEIMWFKAFLPEPPTPMTLIRAIVSMSGLILAIYSLGAVRAHMLTTKLSDNFSYHSTKTKKE
jgi:hypothetical protein